MGRGNFRPHGAAFQSTDGRVDHEVYYVDPDGDLDYLIGAIRGALPAHFDVDADDRENRVVSYGHAGRIVTSRPIFGGDARIVVGIAEEDTYVAVYVAALIDDECQNVPNDRHVWHAIHADAARVRAALLDLYEVRVPTSAWTSARIES